MQADNQPIIGTTISYETPKALATCLKKIRRAYPTIPIFVISDGNNSLSHQKICNRYKADFHVGHNIKEISNGAKWWDRFFKVAIGYQGDYILKIDPDTWFHRPFRYFSSADFFGDRSYDKGKFIQGGIQGFSRKAVERILESGLCQDDRYKNYDKFGYVCGGVRQVSTDHTMKDIATVLEFTVSSWSEVESKWRLPKGFAFRPDKAVTHPHKPTAQKWRHTVERLKAFFPNRLLPADVVGSPVRFADSHGHLP